MAVEDWLANLTDEYITEWANKGLLRRGRKQLEKETIASWKTGQGRYQATIDGYQQSLTGEGFGHLRCDCSGVGPCHHLTCFLLGLKELIEEGTIGRPDSEHVPVSQQLLIEDADTRQNLLGKVPIDKAMRMLNQGICAEINEDAKGIVARIEGKVIYQVIVPMGGLAVSLCSCKKERCEHRALVVLQLCADAGIDIGNSTDNLLDSCQKDVLEQAQQWLDALVLQGITGMSRLQIQQGMALMTELKQADLPGPSRLLLQIVKLMEQEQQRLLASSVSRIRYPLARFAASVHAMQSSPMPQPFYVLAGEHRRSYQVKQNLKLVTIGVEVWKTLADYHGYSVHFYAPEEKRYYSLSESRSREHDRDWDPDKALKQITLNGRSIKRLLNAGIVLSKCWCSQDGRLSSREGTLIAEVSDCSAEQLKCYNLELDAIVSEITDTMRKTPYAQFDSLWAVILVREMSQLTFDYIQQRWSGTAIDKSGNVFEVNLADTEIAARAVIRMNSMADTITAVFGRWYVRAESIELSPVSAWSNDAVVQLTLE